MSFLVCSSAVAVNARKGAFAAAEGGTVFLDEIGTLPSELQHKLLRTIQEGTIQRVGADTEIPVDVRIVAATNINLEKECRSG
ncbi:MAG: sigma 54-interacting transcriptional regulator, partial [Bdellovibrionota bacterium]|nr:sigma 54-interacting transcriptional regulator [Bdellovibrionota bacterium]